LGLAIEVAPRATIAVTHGSLRSLEVAVPFEARNLSNLLALFLMLDEADLVSFIRAGGEPIVQAQVHAPAEVVDFVQYASFARVVPTEQSPLDTQALATLAQEGQALLTTIGQNPVLLIEGASGWVVVTAIRKWGRAVVHVGEDAIRYHLPTLLRIPRDA
jgi:hypothetical protein